MQRQYQQTIDGVELERLDINSFSANASLAEERVFAELLRPTRIGTGGVFKGILHYGDLRTHEFEWGPFGIAAPTFVANASVFVPPFRALIGERSTSSSTDAAQTAVRTAVSPGQFGENLQLPATVTNNRWDLIVARVDIDVDEASQTRYVRDIDGNVNAIPISSYRNTAVSLLVVTGAEAATPVRPEALDDTPTTFYIPLAYVFLGHPHTLSSVIAAEQIHEVAQVLSLAPAVGGVDACPARHFNSATGAWGGVNARPREYLPTSMNGKVERFFGLDYTAGRTALPLGEVTVLDNTIDWRRRVFKTVVQIVPVAGNLAWDTASGAVPSAQSPQRTHVVVGQSFGVDFASTGPISPHGHVAHLTQADFSDMAGGSRIEVYVDISGNLCAYVAATTPNALVFVWIEGSGQYQNA